ncbi:MAG TPA: PilZ domain-containing protein [Bryobacteraceae bacterium]|jgi:hypothetical protein|nr:PilZ domain-containing protein [Bryobacteraceae bacterium]
MSGPEKRREQRRQASGTVRIRFEDPRPQEIAGDLVDVSENGFRMAHAFPSLAAGQVVEFSHLEARGMARVMWNRILEQRVETGFFVVGN